MDMIDLITGLVLAGALLFGAGYVIRELAGESIASFFAEHTSQTADDPNKRLIGELGEIVGKGADGELRVRVGFERWNARLAGDEDGGALPVGTPVKVAAVEGLVLRVEPSAAD